MLQYSSNLNRVMDPDTISKNGTNPKNQMSRGNLNLTIIVVCFSICLQFTGCISGRSSGSGTPSSITDKWFSAITKKDYKTAAKYSYLGVDYTDEDKAKGLEQLIKVAIVKYEIKDEQISADGENATVTVTVTVKNLFAQATARGPMDIRSWHYGKVDGETTEDSKIKLINTKTDGWKIDLKSTFSY